MPADFNRYKIEIQVEKLVALLNHLAVPRAHLVGISMGAHTALATALAHPEMTASVVLVGGGSGAGSAGFSEQCRKMATELEEGGMPAMVKYSEGRNRWRFRMNDPLGYEVRVCSVTACC